MLEDLNDELLSSALVTEIESLSVPAPPSRISPSIVPAEPLNVSFPVSPTNEDPASIFFVSANVLPATDAAGTPFDVIVATLAVMPAAVYAVDLSIPDKYVFASVRFTPDFQGLVDSA